ncbi:HNH/ENDO VII superfamily nuclease [Flavobacterium sp. 81]|uniref:HNH endonuclease n=1 Tax=Flavobacterium sp. 81 TaxID=2135621 RepID=UPI000EABDEAD|nr:HNH endonuclease [Flavobacterium sp. 81]RKR08309.1 HNH/ENDO VII superfamily nuclease [Flavobacterium sp. 81]
MLRLNLKTEKTQKDIVFKTNTGAAVNAEWKSNTEAEIKLTKKLDFAKQSIIATVKGAKEKNPADSTKTVEGKSQIAGKINVWDLTKKSAISITLLSINKAIAPSAGEAKKFLNDVYNKVGVTFDVTSQSVNIETLPNQIECGDSDLLNVYTGGQNDIISQIESSPDFKYNEKTYYVLYTGKIGQNGYDGFMPLGGQYAFVFDNTLKTAAHELGHGIFGLKHPFSSNAESGKTDLLMDYGTGTVLSHNDWDIIHSGGWKFYGFQKSSSGALAGGFGLTPNWGFVKTNENTVITGEGVPIVGEGMLGGFESTENNVSVNYIWNTTSKTYKVNGTGADYPASNYVKVSDDKAIIWLIYKNNEVCNNRKYIRTNYGAIKNYLPKENQAGLKTYIDKIDKIAKADKLTIYSNTLGCVESSNTSGNNSGGYVYAEYKLDGETINISSDNKSKLDNFFSALSEVYGKGVKVITYPKGSSKKADADAAYKAEISAGRAAVELEVDSNGGVTKAVFNIESIIGVGNVCIANLVEAKIAQKKKDNPDFDTEGIESVIFKVYYSLQSFVECSLGEENNKDSFLAGFLYEFCQTLDVPQLVGGLKQLGVGILKYSLIETPKGYLQQMKNIFEVSKKLAAHEVITQQDMISVIINPAAYEKYKQVKEAAHNFYGIFITKGNPWRYGRLTMMVVPVVLTLGEYSAVVAARLGIDAAKFARICQTLNRATNLGFEIAVFGAGKIIKPFVKGLSTIERTSNVVTSNVDEIVALTDDVATNETIIASVVDDVEQLPKNVVSLGAEDITKAQKYLSKIGNAGDKVYLIVHGSGETFSVVRNGMSDVVMNHKALAYWLIKNNLKNKNIVLLSCSDLNSAQNLVNKLGGTSKVTAWEGAVTVFENGAIRGEGVCKEFSPGNISKTLSESEIPKGTAGVESGEKVVLGANTAGNLVPNSLIAKLTQSGANKLKAWTSSKSLNFVDEAGNVLTNTNAEAKIFSKIDDAIGNKKVLETFEDTEGRMSVLLETDGVTHDLITIEKNVDGKYCMHKYNRAYNPDANLNYPVNASTNRLVPDFDGTKYLDIDCQDVINLIKKEKGSGSGIKIKMTRGNRNADYSAANKIVQKYIPGFTKPEKYTWHHMDDLIVDANGDAWCTMQLVETTAHAAAGMRHSGAVAQLEKYYSKFSD